MLNWLRQMTSGTLSRRWLTLSVARRKHCEYRFKSRALNSETTRLTCSRSSPRYQPREQPSRTAGNLRTKNALSTSGASSCEFWQRRTTSRNVFVKKFRRSNNLSSHWSKCQKTCSLSSARWHDKNLRPTINLNPQRPSSMPELRVKAGMRRVHLPSTRKRKRWWWVLSRRQHMLPNKVVSVIEAWSRWPVRVMRSHQEWRMGPSLLTSWWLGVKIQTARMIYSPLHHLTPYCDETRTTSTCLLLKWRTAL